MREFLLGAVIAFTLCFALQVTGVLASSPPVVGTESLTVAQPTPPTAGHVFQTSVGAGDQVSVTMREGGLLTVTLGLSPWAERPPAPSCGEPLPRSITPDDVTRVLGMAEAEGVPDIWKGPFIAAKDVDPRVIANWGNRWWRWLRCASTPTPAAQRTCDPADLAPSLASLEPLSKITHISVEDLGWAIRLGRIAARGCGIQ